MKILKNRFVNLFIIISLTGLALYFNLKDIYMDVLKELSNVHLGMFFIAVLLIIIYYVLEGAIITMFSKMYNKSYHLWKGFKNAVIGVLFSVVTPFASGGEAARIYFLSKQGLKVPEAISVCLMKFITYQLILVFYGILAISCKFGYFYTNYRNLFLLVCFGFIVNLGVITGLILAAVSSKFHLFISDYVLKFIVKIKIIRNYEKTRDSFNEQVTNFRKEITNLFKNKGLLVRALLIQILRLFLFYSIAFFCMKTIDVTIPFSKFFDTMILAIFIFNILAVTPIPGDSGVSETFYILLMSTLFEVTIASSSMILWRFICSYFGLILGGIFFILHKNDRIVIDIEELNNESNELSQEIKD